MSLTILSRKLDQLNDRQKVLKLTYDVRGNNKHQHRYIKDLKDDFKEDLQLRFGNKPYGLGWNHDSEDGSERGDQDGEDVQQEIIDDDDDGEVQEEPVEMVSPQTMMSNFRPTSGKTSAFAPHDRPFSASTGRPMTASSVGRGAGGMPQFLFSQRPISAITKMNNKNFQSNTNIDISESTLLMNMKGQYQSNQPGEYTRMQGSRVNPDMSAQMRASESIFWKNTKKYDNNRSTKQFQTKQLLFNSPNSDPRLINSSDLAFLVGGEKIHSTLEKSKLKAPKNHNFQEVARSKRTNKKQRGVDGEASYYNTDPSQLDAKNSFNQSVSYIQSLRTDAKNTTVSGSILSEFESAGKKQRLQRPLTAHPLMSATSPTATQKKPLETVAEIQESSKVYFSSLSDLRKKAFFLKLHSMESEKIEHPGLSKELKTVDWSGFKEISSRADFQSIYLMLIDLNTFDHGKYELEFQANGSLKAKDKEGVREISSVHKEFLNSTKSNIVAMTIYFETTTNRLIDVFSRVLVYEEKENEYDLMIWRNVYRFVLHKIILANSPLYPDYKTYTELSKMIKEIIDDKKDYISPITSQIQLTKDHPIVVERNSHVYTFDFHSYILECSSFYFQCINTSTAQKPTGDLSHRKTDSKSGESLKQRPASAMVQKSKFPMFGSKQSQNVQSASRKESNHIVDPTMFMSAQNMASSVSVSSSKKDISMVNKPALKLAYSPEQLIKFDPTRQNSDRQVNSSRSQRGLKKPQEKFEMIMQGGKMDIYQDIRAASSTMRSGMNLREQSDMMSRTFGGSESQKFWSTSAMQTPNQERMFQMNPNGITVQYVKSPMKKKSNVVIRMRPHSAVKAQIQSHKSAVASSLTSLGNTNRADNPYAFKF